LYADADVLLGLIDEILGGNIPDEAKLQLLRSYVLESELHHITVTKFEPHIATAMEVSAVSSVCSSLQLCAKFTLYLSINAFKNYAYSLLTHVPNYFCAA
jgi:hypothetical protein